MEITRVYNLNISSYLYSGHNNSLRPRVYQLAAGIMSTCPQTEVNDHPASSGVAVVSTLNHPAVVDFVERNYRYKSVTTQIPHDAGLVPIPFTGRRFLPCGNQTAAASCSTNSKQQALNLVVTGPGLT